MDWEGVGEGKGIDESVFDDMMVLCGGVRVVVVIVWCHLFLSVVIVSFIMCGCGVVFFWVFVCFVVPLWGAVVR